MAWIWCCCGCAWGLQPLAWEPPYAKGAALKKGEGNMEFPCGVSVGTAVVERVVWVWYLGSVACLDVVPVVNILCVVWS